MAADRRILVVGAGPTGLTAAVELARRGILPRIVDKDEGPTPLSKAVGISAHSLDILEPSGVAERLLGEGIHVRYGYIHSRGSRLGAIDFAALPHRFNFLLSLPQSETETIMAAILEGFGGRVEWRTKLVGLKAAGDEVDVELEGPSGREAARWSHVFGADGVHSAVRDALGLAFDGYTHKRIWSIADVEVADWPYEPRSMQLFLHGGGDVGLVIPIGKNRFRAVSNTPDAMARIPGRYRVTQLFRTDTFHIPIRQAPTYQRGNVFLGGDAAHVHSPVGARGMNLGIEDAACFARRFAEGTLDGYTAERHPVGRRWIAFSERQLRFAQATGPVETALRNLAIRVMGHFPALQRPALERIAGLRE